MTIDEWLHRLNLLSLKKKFQNAKIRRVQDLQYIRDPGEFGDALEIVDRLQTRRLWNMMIGHPETKENFKYLSNHGIRSIVKKFVADKQKIEMMVDQIP